MNRNLVLQCSAAATFAGLSFGVADTAKAQEIASEVETENRTPIIIVQAQRREENVEDVAIAIAAFNQEILEQPAIEDIRDFAGRAPGLVADRGISSTLPVAGLRTFSAVRAPRQFGGEILFKF